jgi:hypothetical protein
MISETIINEWKRQAEKDGNLDDYEYHLGMFSDPLPYQQWKLKFISLNRIQARPDYFDNMSQSLINKETALCNALGY